MPHQVLGHGPQPAKLLYIGEAPGAEEERTGIPFVGPSGKLRNRWLSMAGIRYQDIRTTNVFKTRPPGNKVSYFFAKGEQEPSFTITSTSAENRKPTVSHVKFEFTDDVVDLMREIEETNPTITILAGDTAAKLITGNPNGITLIRGSVFFSDFSGTTRPYIPVIHPAAVLRSGSPHQWAVSVFDMLKAKRIIEAGYVEPPKRDFVTFPTYSELMAHLDRLYTEAEYLSYDIETGQNASLLCLAISDDSNWAVCFPYLFQGKRHYTTSQTCDIIRALQRLFLRDGIKLIGQNLQFDNVVLAKHLGFRFPPIYLDTMIGFNQLHPQLRKGLDTICSIYTNEPFYKDERKAWSRVHDWQRLYSYNCLDAAATLECALALEPEIRNRGIWESVQERQRLIVPLTAAQFKGILIDTDAQARGRDKLQDDLDEIQAAIDTEAGYHVDINSPKQVGEFFFGTLGIKAKKLSAKTGNPSTDKATLLKLSYTHPIARKVVEARAVSKLISTYINIKLDPDNRIRPIFDAAGTYTGRLSSRMNYFGTGVNMQNIAKHSDRAKNYIRPMYVADPGKVLIEIDYSQAEAKVVAYLTEDLPMIRAYENGMDVHSMRVSLFTGEPYDSFVARYKSGDKTAKELRDLAKKGTHGVHYGMGFFKLQETLATGGPGGEGAIYKTSAETKRFIADIKRANPGLELWHREVREQLNRNRTLTNCFGDKCTFWGPWGDELFKSAYAWEPQGTIGRLTCKLLQAIYDNHAHEADILANVHDSVLLQTDEANTDNLIHSCFKLAAIPITIKNRTFTIPVEAEVGYNWRDMEEWGDES